MSTTACILHEVLLRNQGEMTKREITTRLKCIKKARTIRRTRQNRERQSQHLQRDKERNPV